MCLDITFKYGQCGHYKEVHRSCSRTSTGHAYHDLDGTSLQQLKLKDDFCPTCLTLPDPRSTPLHTPQLVYEYAGFFRSSQNTPKVVDVVVRDILRRAQALKLSRCECPWEPLGDEDVKKLEEINSFLVDDFWNRLKNDIAPTIPHRRLMIRVQEVIHWNLAVRAACTELSPYDWLIAFEPPRENRFTPIDLASLPEDDRLCIICRQEMNEGSEDSSPVRTACRHVFCCPCIEEWLNYQAEDLKVKPSCPYCRTDLTLRHNPIPLGQIPPGLAYDQRLPSMPHAPLPAWLASLQYPPPREGLPANVSADPESMTDELMEQLKQRVQHSRQRLDAAVVSLESLKADAASEDRGRKQLEYDDAVRELVAELRYMELVRRVLIRRENASLDHFH